ncbi:hypothetical protein V8F06_009305 [Rhypophila decipiens]
MNGCFCTSFFFSLTAVALLRVWRARLQVSSFAGGIRPTAGRRKASSIRMPPCMLDGVLEMLLIRPVDMIYGATMFCGLQLFAFGALSMFWLGPNL